jgi:hypothetical protein
MTATNVTIPRDVVLGAIYAGRALSLTGLVVAFSLLCIESYTIFERWAQISWRRAKSRVLLWLGLISLTGVLVTLTCVVVWWGNWLGREQSCSNLVAPLLPLLYITMKQCLYLFLFDRAKVVHDALKINGHSIRILRWVVFLACTLGVPFLTWWSFILHWRGKVLPEGVCVEYTVSIAGLCSVAAADFILSFAMLILFLLPVMRHVQRIRDDELSPIFRRTLRRNLWVSSIMLMSTLIALIAMSVQLSVSFGDSPDPSTEHLQIWATFFPLFDTIVTVILPHFLSGAWVPTKLRARMHSSSHKPTPFAYNQHQREQYQMSVSPINKSVRHPTSIAATNAAHV